MEVLSSTYTPSFPAILHQLGCSLAISTYQAGKVVIICAPDENRIIQLPRSFKKPMGIALNGQHMAIATEEEVITLVNAPGLAPTYPIKQHTYDAMYMPRITYHTGAIDIHDLAWSGDGSLYAVNTSFSCLIKIDGNYSFTPVWKPPFISSLASEDRCHLNGMAMRAGKPAFVTAFNRGDTFRSWKEEITTGGIVMDISDNRIIAEGLAMPHSPRWWNDQLFVLLSATGEIAIIDIKTGTKEVLARLNGFVRGMAKAGDFIFIGLSAMRESATDMFRQMPIADQSKEAGIAILHLPSCKIAGEIRFHQHITEIYDIVVLEGQKRPNILNTIKPEYRKGLSIPGTTFWAQENH